MSDDATDFWYYEHDGTKQGPVTIDVLRDLLANGEVASTTRVWNKRDSHGLPADRVPQLCFLDDVDLILSEQQPLRLAESENLAVIRMTCRCGKRLRIRKEAAGRRVLCPKCRQAFQAVPPHPVTAKPASPHESVRQPNQNNSSFRSSSLIPWVAVSLFVAASVGLIVWLLNQDFLARQKNANEKVAIAVANAEVWLAKGAEANPLDGQKLKDVLESSLQAPDATIRSPGHEAVMRVTRRLSELDAASAAEKSFSEGKTLLDQGNLEEAIRKLTSYEAAASAQHRPEATALLAQIAAATNVESMRGWLLSQDDAALQQIRESKKVVFGDVSYPVLRAKQGILAAAVAQSILDERARTRLVNEGGVVGKDRTASDRTAKEALAKGTLTPASRDSPKGFRGLTWGDPPSPDMRSKAQTRYDAARGIVEYTRPNESLQVGNVPVKSLTYDFRDGRFVAVTLSVLGNNTEFREIVESQFGPFELVHEPRTKLGWPFNPLNGVPLDGFAKKYASGPSSVVCVLDVDNGIGTTILVRLMAAEEAERLDKIRRQILKEAGRDF